MCGRCGTSNSQKVTMDFNGAPESWGKNVSKHIKTSIETSQTTPGAKQTQFYHKKPPRILAVLLQSYEGGDCSTQK